MLSIAFSFLYEWKDKALSAAGIGVYTCAITSTLPDDTQQPHIATPESRAGI